MLRGHAVLNAEVAANEAIFKLAGIKLTESRRILLVTNAGVRIGEAITEGSELVVKVLSAIATTSILTVDSCEIQILN